MLIFLLIYLLLSNAVTIRRDKSILFSIIAIKSLLLSSGVTIRRYKSILFSIILIKSLLFTSFLQRGNLYVRPLEMGIGVYGGLFNVTVFTQSFNIFILIISALILTLIAFYTKKVYLNQYSSIFNLLLRKLSYNKKLISNKTAEQFSIIEYGLIIVFITINSFLSSSISVLTLLPISFIYVPGEWFNIVSILTLILFKT